MKIFLAVFSLALAGCGTTPKTADSQAQNTSDTTAPTAAAPAPAPTVNIPVTVNSTQNNDEQPAPAAATASATKASVAAPKVADEPGDVHFRDDYGSDAIYRAMAAPYEAMVKGAPTGYRLATRAELVALIDGGVSLENHGFEDTLLWSADTDDSGFAWSVAMGSGQQVATDVKQDLRAVFVADGTAE